MNLLAGDAGGLSAEEAGGGRVGKADEAVAIYAAYAIGDRVEQDLLLPVEFLRASPLL